MDKYQQTETKLVPLGDQAVLAYFAQEQTAGHFAMRVREENPAWLVDVVQAYASVAVFFDLEQITYSGAAAVLDRLAAQDAASGANPVMRLHHIPCCYELELDLARVVEHTGLKAEEAIHQHAAMQYVVYAIGFCPGFPYLGYLPASLSGMPRLPAPRLRLEAGSVGLTGRQTGIYTEPRPGGWNIIGRTPLELVHVVDGYFPLRTGDQVQFTRIDEAEFGRLLGERL
jgi:inhibitor of KinA